ncbi:MFS transporter [uncultured Brevibacillus sp.]|uniref:MFS transporter n=1 Tax=uncultured Brevibacillus sp. TaxID=169970 RepID=UPI002595A843|nr:MFS transporter [uncultured Brevibacillus sp.]
MGNQKTFPLLLVNMFLAMLGIGLVIPVLPQFLHEFGAGGQAAGYLVSCFGLTQFLFSPIAGNLADKYGRKPMIVLGLGLFALSNLCAAIADNLWLLFVSRLIGGAGSAALVPSIMAYAADITTNEQRTKAMSYIGASMSSGFIIGPGVGGLLAEFGMRAPFFASACIGVLAMLGSMIVLPEPLSLETRMRRQQSTVKKPNVFVQLALSIKSRFFVLLFLVFALTFGLTHFEAIYPLYVVQSYGFTTLDIAILFTVCSLIGTVNQVLLTTKLIRRFGEKTTINYTLLLSSISLVFLLFSGNFWYVMFVTMMFFTCNNILRPTINTLLSKGAGEQQGFVAGMNNAYMSLGNIFGPVLAGILFDIQINLPYLFGAFVLLIAYFVSVKWIESKRAITSLEMS